MVGVVGVSLAGLLDWGKEKRRKMDDLSVVSATDPPGWRESIAERKGLVKNCSLKHTNLLLVPIVVCECSNACRGTVPQAISY